MGTFASASAEMGYTRFIQNGRIVLINYGPDANKLAVICDVVDQNRCVVYGPSTGVARQIIGYKRLSLTDIVVPLGRGAKAGTVTKVWESEDVEGKWAATSWGKKMAARKAKASASDFDRSRLWWPRRRS